MRLNSLDVVRGFAIFAMIIAHTVVFLDDREPRILEVLFHFLNDAASPLFALVIGVTAGYQLRDAARWDGRRKSFFAISWVIKAIVLILVGLLLSINFSGVLIVLDFLGIMMLVATPFLFLPAAWSAGAALAFLAAAPLVNEAARNWALTSAFSPTSMYDPTALLLDWTVLGSAYRLTNLLPMLLIGFLLARWQLGNLRRTAWVFGGGSGAPRCLALHAPPRGGDNGHHPVRLLRGRGSRPRTGAARLRGYPTARRLLGRAYAHLVQSPHEAAR